MKLSAHIPWLRALLETGFAPNLDEAWPVLRFLTHPLAEEHARISGWIFSQRLLAVRPQLASDDELVCALLAQQPEVRDAWLALAAARCTEAGQMTDAGSLMELVSGLGPAAAWVDAALPRATLSASPFANLEREVLGMSFEQSVATPALVRILAVAAHLAQFDRMLPPLPVVDASGFNAQQNWMKGRLLALPVTSVHKPVIASEVVLHGQLEEAARDGQTAMNWVLAHPWPLLLVMLAFAQDTWAAENRGGLLLELPVGQNAFAPSEIILTVVGPDGDEVRCGTLADLLLNALTNLGMACFPYQPTPSALNAQLSSLVGLLLKRSVWRYQDGASSQLGQYQIHPHFSDQCYALPASRIFNRTGKGLWQTLRLSAEALYQEHNQTYQRQIVRELQAEFEVQREATDE